jgi:ABC-2 type transport system permease protein
MKVKRMLAFTRRALAQFRHDRRTLGFVLIMPLLMMLIFGYTFGGEPAHLDVGLVDMDQDAISHIIIDNLDEETFNLIVYDDLVSAEAALRDARLWGVIYFPSNFSVNLVLRFTQGGTEPSIIDIHLDDTNPNIAGTIIKGVQQALRTTAGQITSAFNLTTGAEPVTLNTFNVYSTDREIRFIDYFAPGVISFAIMMVTIMITIILFVNERKHGTLQRLLASPASETEIVLGYALAFSFIGLCQSLIILLAAILVFDITIVGNVLLALFVALLLAFGHQGLGILLSSAAKNELQAIQFIPLIIFPSVLLAGLFWPVESIPSYLQPISYFIPLKYAIDAERGIMLKGWGIGDVWLDIAILVAFAILMLGASILLLKRRKE